MIVANSSPIIVLAKQGLISLFKKCFGKVIIPQSVYDEIVQKQGSLEEISLNKAIREKWILVQKVGGVAELDTKNIGEGEKEAILLAYNHKSLLIIDDDSAKNYASILGVEAHGTLFVIYTACARKIIDKGEALRVLEAMIKDGFYISSEIHFKFASL